MINVVLYQPEIAPNTGNIIRTCYCTGAKLHIIKPIAFDLHPKWLKRSAAGILLSDIEHEIHDSYADFHAKYKNEKIFYITRYGMQKHTAPNYSEVKGDIFLMFGRESTGIDLKVLKNNLAACVRIPMTSKARSLNLANTVMLMVYEVHRQTGDQGLEPFEVQKGKDWLLKQ